jgi:hypothetical protein
MTEINYKFFRFSSESCWFRNSNVTFSPLAGGWRANSPLFHILPCAVCGKDLKTIFFQLLPPSPRSLQRPPISPTWSKMRQQHNNRDQIISVVFIAHGQNFCKKLKIIEEMFLKKKKKTDVELTCPT